MRKAIIFIAVTFLLAFYAAPVHANDILPLPHAFCGTVTINGSPAPVNTSVEARGNGVITGGEGNPITVSEAGKYGSPEPLGQKLIVKGDISVGTTITFYVNGVSTSQTYPFASGETTPLDLSVTIAAPPAYVGGGGGRAAPPTVETNLFGTEWSFRISDDGEILTTIEATSEDGNLTITLPAGTIALDKYGNPLDSLEVAVDESPPDPPEDAHIIGLAYDFGPKGATFDPAITLTWSYDPEALPDGVLEEDLVIACYVAGEWVELECVVDTENNTITASVEHFTTFAIIGAVPPPPPPPPPAPAPAAFSVSNLSIKPIEVQPKEAVAISVSIANTGGTEGSYTAVLKINGVKEVEKRVTLAAGSTEMWFLFVEREEAGSYSVTVDGLSASFTVVAPAPPVPPEVKPPAVPPVKPAINWPVLGAIIAAVILVGLLIFFLVRRRA